MKKKRIGIFDIGRLPVTPTKYADDEKPTTTLRQFRADEARREQEAAAKTQAEIERVQKDTSRLMAECLSVSAPMMTKFWSQPLDKIKARLHDDDVFDNLFLPTSDETTEPNAIYDAIQQFLDDDVFAKGYLLGDTSRRRFGLYVASQVNAGVIINPASLAVMYDRCFELGIFKNDSGTEFNEGLPRIKAVVEQPRVERPVDQPQRATMDNLMAVNVDGRGGFQEAAQIADELYFDERQPIVQAWFDSLAKHFGIVITHADANRCKKWFERNNKSFLGNNFNECRRWMVSSGYWPESCLTNLEVFSLSLEGIDTSRLTVQQRNDLNRRELAAREADIARFGHI